jgi:hypothetical protein
MKLLNDLLLLLEITIATYNSVTSIGNDTLCSIELLAIVSLQFLFAKFHSILILGGGNATRRVLLA